MLRIFLRVVLKRNVHKVLTPAKRTTLKTDNWMILRLWRVINYSSELCMENGF